MQRAINTAKSRRAKATAAIIEAQRKEIGEMKALIDELEKK